MSFFDRVKAGLWRRGVLKSDVPKSGLVYSGFDIPSRVSAGCTHGHIASPTEVRVGHGMVTVLSAPICAACVRMWLEEVSETCATCGLPIVPGMKVSETPFHGESGHPFTHATFGCDDSNTCCGVLGNDGGLTALH
jgi:hypothetical protein